MSSHPRKAFFLSCQSKASRISTPEEGVVPNFAGFLSFLSHFQLNVKWFSVLGVAAHFFPPPKPYVFSQCLDILVSFRMSQLIHMITVISVFKFVNILDVSLSFSQ